MPATTISIATHKGGTGKTVTAMAISSALARRDIFVDSSAAVAKIIRTTHIDELDVLPSNIRLERAAYLIYTRPKREDVLRKALQPVANSYSYIVIDCPPSLGPLTESAIAAADVILIPCQMEARAADGLVDLLEVVHIIKGDNFDRWRILLTRVDKRASESRGWRRRRRLRAWLTRRPSNA